jgi:hypothetical protein
LALGRKSALNINRHCQTFEAKESFDRKNWRAVMAKKAGVSSSALQDSDSAQFVSVALFSGVGLLISIVIVICRIHGLF